MGGDTVREFTVKTSQKEEFIDITSRVQECVAAERVSEGICCVFVPHTTCGLLVNEHFDPDVAIDVRLALDRLVPLSGSYLHAEGNSPAHIKASLVGTSHTFLISDGKMCLGRWQGIFLCEFDGPRERKVWVGVIQRRL
ncbi:MAG: YjbQ family protein [Candidatus Fermentithermobacillus carboniphilus]|uniref:YjbQ family protein n=1 Tax=Candidatus Fermentithermobacillus carboniphilus TaxID=3085328 RepID=A0AAT9LE03_9FIRM|nr:MAG: YjbQ family protein [Candidatus Fermentithermobacillus carboniphilus]